MLDQSNIEKLGLPLEFIAFGMIDGKMYKHFGNRSVFILPEGDSKLWGNCKIYGALFVCKDFDFYISLLDAYHACSKDKLRRNHIKDIHHRIKVDVTPIRFNTLNELSRLMYKEGEIITATSYIGNIDHPRIKRRFITTKSYRVIDGIDKSNYTKLFRRVC